MLFAKRYSLPIGVARPFNNYGPGMRITDKRVPADFAKAVYEGQDIQRKSDQDVLLYRGCDRGLSEDPALWTI